jgi:ABC-type antimicrobial peptide transport system permease subunit
MNTKQLLGLVGSIILFVGVFAPIVSVPFLGNMNYFQNGKGDGIIVLVLAVASLALVLTKNYKGLWFTGLGSLGLMLFTFINFQSKMSQIKSQMESQLTGNPFRGLADMAMQSVQLQWGWALLIVGAGLVIASAALKEESK